MRYQAALEARDLESALIHARDAAQYASNELGARHARTGILMYNLGAVQLRLEHNRDASTTLRKAVSIYRAAYGKDAPETIGPYDKLGLAFEAQGELGPAERAYAEILRLVELDSPGDHAEIARVLVRLASVAEALEERSRVRNYGLRAIRALEADTEDRSLEIGMMHLRLAKNELERGDGRLALKHMEAATPLYEDRLEATDRQLIAYYSFMAQAYDLLGKHSTARKYEKRLEKSQARAGDGS